MRKSLMFLLALALILGFTSNVIAFTLERWTADPQGLVETQPHMWPWDGAGRHNFIHWDLREFAGCEVPWSPGNGTADPDCPGNTEFDAVVDAFDVWEGVVPSVIGFNAVQVIGAQEPLNLDNNNLIGWGGGLGAGTLGMTAVWAVGSAGFILEADILFNDPNFTWVIRPGGRLVSYDFDCNSDGDVQDAGDIDWDGDGVIDREAEVQTCAMHEIGHLVGLGHMPMLDDLCNGVYVSDYDAPPFGNWPGAEDRDVNGNGTLETPVQIMDYPFHISDHSLSPDDRQGLNFLYTPDIGDAPDPPYPSLVHGPGAGAMLNGVPLYVPDDGAEHIFGTKGHSDPDDTYLYEWLGLYPTGDVSGECESKQINQDDRDDGVVFTIGEGALNIEVTVATDEDEAGNSHNYAAHDLYLNIWVDWNDDGDWDDGGEHVVGPGEAVNPPGSPSSIVNPFVVAIPPGAAQGWGIRTRLDWGEDCGAAIPGGIDQTLFGPRGAAQFGEVEDTFLVVLCEPTGIIRDNTNGFVPVDGDPRGSTWHELAPDYCEPWTLTSWISKDGYLNYCDIVDFTHDITGVISWEHVERVMPTITVTEVTYPEDLIYLDMIDENPMVYPITHPVGTYWKEVYPEYCHEYELEWWDDNGNGYLDYCDYIGLHAVNGLDSCTTKIYHVEDVSTDLETTPITPCVCPDSTEVLPGHNATIHLNMCNVPEIGGFDFVVKYDPSGLNFLSAKPLGEVAEWEYFTYRYSEQDNCGGGCPTGYIRVVGIADMPNGEMPDEAIFQPEGHFVELTFGTTEDLSFIGQCFHIDWGWFDCGDNTMSSRSGDILYLADDIEEILPDEDCLAGDKGYTPIPVIDFCHGIICIIPPPDDRGDINMNGVANEIADAVLFANYFIYGPSVWDPVFYENQILATDVNDDGIPLTVADLVYLIRIITGDANPYPESGEGGKITPDHLTAAVDWRIVGDHVAVDFTSESDAGAILLAFDHHGAEFGEPVLSDRASAMTMISHNNGAQLRVLLYGMERGASIPAGTGAILTIPITTQDPGLVLAEVEASDYYGNMMTVESTRPTYVPKEFALFQNIPNPFNATTRIDFNLPEAGEVTLVVYDVLGRRVATLVDGHLEPGAHHITWNSRDEYGAEVASGVYFYRITTDKHQASRKMVLVK